MDPESEVTLSVAGIPNNQQGVLMAKLVANCVLMGVAKNPGKDGAVYSTAQLFFSDDNTSLPVGIDRKKPELVTELEKVKMVEGMATIAIREFKGTKYLDLVAFQAKK